MLIFAHILTLFIIGSFLSIPMLKKPLSEDDGYWFYLTIFYKRGERLFKTFFNAHGYFGVQWIVTLIYNMLGLNKIASIYCIKACWYITTSASIYWLSFCLWQDHFLSLTAGIIFLVITAIPNTLFVLTYAEHFFILPINLSLILSYYGIMSGQLYFFVLAALMSSWAFQFKPTTLLFNMALPVWYIFSPAPFLSIGLYIVVFSSFYVLPLVLMGRNNKKGRDYYLNNSLGPVLHLMEIYLKRLPIESLFKRLKRFTYSEENKVYTQKQYSFGITDQLAAIKEYLVPAFKDLYIILILAAVQIPLLFVSFDPFVLVMWVLSILFLFAVYFQRNYYTPHFNPCWAPISILAAKTFIDILPYLLKSGILGWILLVFISVESFKILFVLTEAFSKKNRDRFGFMNPLLGSLCRLSEIIGGYIKNHSKRDDRLFVWGDQPSIYLYADREIIDKSHLQIYAHQGFLFRESELLNDFKESSPEWLLFYNYKVNDGWDMERLHLEAGISYRLIRRFTITDPDGKVIRDDDGILYDFPLYRRDDKKYRELLLDKAMIAHESGEKENALKYLEKIIILCPDDYEASIYRKIYSTDNGDTLHQRDYLKSELSNVKDPLKQSVLLRLMGEMELREGRFESAFDKLQKGLSINPNDYRIYNRLGELSFISGETDDAMIFFHKGMGINPNSVQLLNNIGVALADKGRPEEAVKCFTRAISYIPFYSDAKENLRSLE